MIAKIIQERIYLFYIIFSILSLLASFIICLLLFINKQIRSFSYKILRWILISEILNNIGNIIQYSIFKDQIELVEHVENVEDVEHVNPPEKNSKIHAYTFLVSFSDFFTNLLFTFFSYCSIKLIKETNRTIKNKANVFLIITAIVSILYAILFVSLNNDHHIRFENKDIIDNFRTEQFKEFKEENSHLSFPCAHLIVICILSIISLAFTHKVIVFLREKEKDDKINKSKIIKLNKMLYRFPIICISYWIFLFPRIITFFACDEDNILRLIFYFLSMSFLSLRGIFIVLNIIRTSKIQIIINRFIEVDVKHALLCSSKKK